MSIAAVTEQAVERPRTRGGRAADLGAFSGLPAALRQLRVEAGLSVTAAKDRARLHYTTLYDYESGREIPTLCSLARLLAAYNCSLLRFAEVLLAPKANGEAEEEEEVTVTVTTAEGNEIMRDLVQRGMQFRVSADPLRGTVVLCWREAV